MSKEKAKKHKGTHKAAFPIGSLIIILAAIGIVTIVVSAVKGIGTAVEKNKHYEEYDSILTPVVLIDPDTFDDITKADMNQLMEITIWSLLKSDIAPDTFESNESGLVVPKNAVEKEFVELFGTEVVPVHQTIEGYGLEFVYDTKTEAYTVPLTGITPIYTPRVVDKTTSSDTVVLTVACLAGDAWEQGENGDMIAPTPDKYIKITLREQNDNLYISAIQNTTTPEAATTPGTTESATAETNDDVAASGTATEAPSSTEAESSSADTEAEQ